MNSLAFRFSEIKLLWRFFKGVKQRHFNKITKNGCSHWSEKPTKPNEYNKFAGFSRGFTPVGMSLNSQFCIPIMKSSTYCEKNPWLSVTKSYMWSLVRKFITVMKEFQGMKQDSLCQSFSHCSLLGLSHSTLRQPAISLQLLKTQCKSSIVCENEAVSGLYTPFSRLDRFLVSSAFLGIFYWPRLSELLLRQLQTPRIACL